MRIRKRNGFVGTAALGLFLERSSTAEAEDDNDDDNEAAYLFRRALPTAAVAGSSDFAVAAGFFLPSICARLCLSAAIRSTTGASFFGFSTAATSPPSSLVSISLFRFSWKLSLYFSGFHSSASASMSWWATFTSASF